MFEVGMKTQMRNFEIKIPIKKKIKIKTASFFSKVEG